MHSDPETARVVQLQELLLPLSPRALCEQLQLNWWAAAQLHTAGLLSFDPLTTGKLDELQEVELRFVGALIVAGCDHAMLARLLAGLEKPYCYRPDQLYYHWPLQEWRLLPKKPEDPAPSSIFEDWLSSLEAEEDLSTLEDIRDRVAATIATIQSKRASSDQRVH